MEPLDLRARPPRSPYETLDGLVLMPRTIDKLRALLPGGDPGDYFINPPVEMTGLSGFLLQRLQIDESDLRRVVADAADETEVAAWIRAHTDASRYEEINGILTHLKRKHVTDKDFYESIYGATLAERPELDVLFDIMLADDERMFREANA